MTAAAPPPDVLQAVARERIGNSVLPRFAQAIAESIRDQILCPVEV